MRLEKLKMPELKKYCQEIGIDTNKKKKNELLEAALVYQKQLILDSINTGNASIHLTELLAEEYATNRF